MTCESGQMKRVFLQVGFPGVPLDVSNNYNSLDMDIWRNSNLFQKSLAYREGGGGLGTVECDLIWVISLSLCVDFLIQVTFLIDTQSLFAKSLWP